MPDSRRCPACGEECEGPETHVCGRAVPSDGGEEPSRYGEILAGRWVLLERVGEGGSGVVYRAFDRQLEVHVAVKILRPDLPAESLLRFKREIRITRDIDHENVCRVFDLGESEGRLFLTMRWSDGEPLNRRVRRDGPLGVRELRRLALGLVSALAAVHRRSVVHRDVKPANVLVEVDGSPVLLDFGVATAESSVPTTGDGGSPNAPTPDIRRDDAITVEGHAPGTPAYMAPEQARGAATPPATDLWGLGLTVAYAATGQVGRPEQPSRVFAPLGRPLSTLLARCLEEDLGRRPRDAASVESALAAAARRRSARLAGAAAIVLAAALGAIAFVGRGALQSDAVLPLVRVESLENRTGDPSVDWLEHGVAELLRVGFEASGRVRLAAVDRPGRTARVGGRVVRSGGTVAVELSLRSREGNRIAEARVPRPTGEELFQDVDAAVRKFLVAMDLPVPAEPPGKRRVLLTSNAQAFAHWARAQDLLRHHRMPDALDELRRATTFDPAFAFAQLERYAFGMGTGSGAELEAALARARENRVRLSPSQRELLASVLDARRVDRGNARFDRLRAFLEAAAPDPVTYALAARVTRNVPAVNREVVQEWVDRLPNDAEAHNQLGYAFLKTGDPDSAEREFREYLRLAPDFPNAHDSFGDFLRGRGRLAEALAAYDRALELDPTFYVAAVHSLEVAIASDDLAAADARVASTREILSPTAQFFRRWMWASAAVPLLAGDLTESFRRLERITADPQVGSRAFYASEYEAIVWGLEGDEAQARGAAREAERLSRLFHGSGRFVRGLEEYAVGLAAHRRRDRATLARAAEAPALRSREEDAPAARRRAILAGIRLVLEGSPSAGAERLLVPPIHQGPDGTAFLAALERARALVEAGQLPEADTAYDEAVSRRASAATSPEAAHEWAACLREAAARARARGEGERARELDSRIPTRRRWE